MVGGGERFYLKFWVNHNRPSGPRCSDIAHFEPIIAHSASAVTPSEKAQLGPNTNKKCFPMSL